MSAPKDPRLARIRDLIGCRLVDVHVSGGRVMREHVTIQLATGAQLTVTPARLEGWFGDAHRLARRGVKYAAVVLDDLDLVLQEARLRLGQHPEWRRKADDLRRAAKRASLRNLRAHISRVLGRHAELTRDEVLAALDIGAIWDEAQVAAVLAS